MNTAELLTGWRKSSRSNERRDCVEVGFAPGLVGVRDTKDRDGGTLAFTRAAWRNFSAKLRSGALDKR
ncbi:DUF397 domain-containing protein [Saccharopolyspora sp. NPDC050389]|uniref:DUF397 domain-containing protein n=1 Tax=Saccharopolyspora sp. NPDC050389 TaxID=3155516 RepID=UPI0033F61278